MFPKETKSMPPKKIHKNQKIKKQKKVKYTQYANSVCPCLFFEKFILLNQDR